MAQNIISNIDILNSENNRLNTQNDIDLCPFKVRDTDHQKFFENIKGDENELEDDDFKQELNSQTFQIENTHNTIINKKSKKKKSYSSQEIEEKEEKKEENKNDIFIQKQNQSDQDENDEDDECSQDSNNRKIKKRKRKLSQLNDINEIENLYITQIKNEGIDNYFNILKIHKYKNNDDEILQFDRMTAQEKEQLIEENKQDVNQERFKIFNIDLLNLVKTKHFIAKMKNFMIGRNQHDLNEEHVKYINDKAFTKIKNFQIKQETVWQKLRSAVTMKKIDKKLLQGIKCAWLLLQITTCLKNFKTLNPSKNLNVLREITHIICLIFTMFYVPLEIINQISFGELYGETWKIFVNFTYAYFIFDIVIMFNTGVYEKGVIITSRKKIAIIYLKDQFLQDLLSLIPLLANNTAPFTLWRIMNFLVYLKIFTVVGIYQNLQDIVNQRKPNSYWGQVIQVLRLVQTIFFCSHIVSCCFLAIAKYEGLYGMTTTWFASKSVFDGGGYSQWFVNYIMAMHFSITTMATVGYGDITPVTLFETIFVIFDVCVSCLIFAYTFNSIGAIIDSLNKEKKVFKQDMQLVNRYLDSKKVTDITKTQVRKFLEYQYKIQDDISLEQEEYVLNKLPHQLRDKVQYEQKFHLIEKCKRVFGNFSSDFQENLIMQFNEIRVAQNEILFNDGDVEMDPLFFYVEKGQIQLDLEIQSAHSENRNLVIKVLDEGTYFGEKSFFTCQQRACSATALRYSKVYYIRQSDFIKVLKEFPLDSEKFYLMRDKLLIQKQQYSLHSRCYACDNYDHFVEKCPQIHYEPDKEQKILQYLYSYPQIRYSKWRRHNVKQKGVIRNQFNLQTKQMAVYLSHSEFMTQYVQQYIKDPEKENITLIKSQNSRQTVIKLKQEQTYLKENQLQKQNQDDIVEYLDYYKEKIKYRQERPYATENLENDKQFVFKTMPKKLLLKVYQQYMMDLQNQETIKNLKKNVDEIEVIFNLQNNSLNQIQQNQNEEIDPLQHQQNLPIKDSYTDKIWIVDGTQIFKQFQIYWPQYNIQNVIKGQDILQKIKNIRAKDLKRILNMDDSKIQISQEFSADSNSLELKYNKFHRQQYKKNLNTIIVQNEIHCKQAVYSFFSTCKVISNFLHKYDNLLIEIRTRQIIKESIIAKQRQSMLNIDTQFLSGKKKFQSIRRISGTNIKRRKSKLLIVEEKENED